jgi:uncharacterized OB-fold protein
MARTVAGKLPVGFRYTPGVGNGAFFEALRASGSLIGARCDTCSITYLPARIFCERCLAELTPGVECGPEGELVSWTRGHVDLDDAPLTEPVTIGLVRLDGADTVLMHRMLGDAPPEIGQRVRVEVRGPSERTGSILDIEGFRPA